MKHGGSGTAYSHFGCRCEECTEANRARVGRRRAQRRGEPIPASVKHGTTGAYGNWHCRCKACTQANSAASARRRLAVLERERMATG